MRSSMVTPRRAVVFLSEELEAITRRFAFMTYKRWWRPNPGEAEDILKENFFRHLPWAGVLELVDKRLIRTKVATNILRSKRYLCSALGRIQLAELLKPSTKNAEGTGQWDSKFRTIFEATHDLLLGP